MQFGWFDLNWPWIGVAISAAMLVLLLGTDKFRNDLTVSRWRDPLWLAWLAPAAYMLHQAEEYGIDMLGQRFAFPDLLCASFGQPPYPTCNVPTDVFVAINIPVIWIAGLICALMARRHALTGLGLYAIHASNAPSHIGTAIATGSYNPGLLTACLILLPLALWVAYATWRDPRIRTSGLAVILLAGIIFTVVLLTSLRAFEAGLIGGGVVVAIQVLNASIVVLLPWWKERRDHRTRIPT